VVGLYRGSAVTGLNVNCVEKTKGELLASLLGSWCYTPELEDLHGT
jgi:hypothetical protein